MSRSGVGAATLTRLGEDSTGIAYFVKIEFPGAAGTAYLHSGVGSIVWGGNTWTGVGDLGSISPINESIDAKPHQVTLGLSGVNTSYVTEVQADNIQGSKITIYLGALEEDLDLTEDPFEFWSGLISEVQISLVADDENGSSAKIEITAESRMIQFARKNGAKYTNADQQRRYAGDLFFEYAALLADQDLRWASKAVSLRGDDDFKFDHPLGRRRN